MTKIILKLSIINPFHRNYSSFDHDRSKYGKNKKPPEGGLKKHK